MNPPPEIDFDRILTEPHYFEQLWDNPMIGLAVLDFENRFVFVNETYARILGRVVEEVIGRTWMEFTTEDTVRADTALAAATATGAVPVYECDKKYLRPDGREVAVRIAVKSIYTPEGARLCFYTTCIESDLKEGIVVPQPQPKEFKAEVVVPQDEFISRVKRADAVFGLVLKAVALLGTIAGLGYMLLRFVIWDITTNGS